MPEAGNRGLHQAARPGQDPLRSTGQETSGQRARLLLRSLVQPLRHRSLNRPNHFQTKVLISV